MNRAILFCFFILRSITWSYELSAQGRFGCDCVESLHYIEVVPQQPSEVWSFKKLLAKHVDTLLFKSNDTTGFILKFDIDRCGNVLDVNTIYSSTDLHKFIVKALPEMSQWRPGNNGGKVVCVYVALKFEIQEKEWHIKRLDPYTFKEDSKLFFME